MDRYDFVVIGSGVAGLSFALKAATLGSVLLVTKKKRSDTNTSWAQGGISCVTSPEDSFDLHVADTLNAGAGLCHEEVVRSVVEQAPQRLDELMAIGVEFDQRENGSGSELDLGVEGGHSKRRILHSRDTTGKEVQSKLLEAVAANPHIDLRENHHAIDLITSAKLGLATEDRIEGLYIFDEVENCVWAVRSSRVILATGGCGRVYQYTTNPSIATGDGVAMAWRANAMIANMEFIQFHPTCLYHRDLKTFLISEAVRGEGGRLIDAEGNAFMARYDERGELAPRDIVARAIDSEIKRSGKNCVYLDISHRGKDFIADRFPNIYQTCLRLGIDASREPIPVVPAAHYQCGGVRTNIHGASSIRGLYAIGEVAGTGLHGANRLASNSLLEGLVMAHNAFEDIQRNLPPVQARPQEIELPEWKSGDVTDVDELVVIYHNWDEIRRLMWDYVSIVRTEKRLLRAATRLRNLKNEVQEFYWNFKVTAELLELRNLVEVASLIVDCAVKRKESRGLHYMLDYPDRYDERYGRDTLVRRF